MYRLPKFVQTWKSLTDAKKPRCRSTSFQGETLESRSLMAGDITFANGVISIQGTDAYADFAKVEVDTRGTLLFTDDLLRVTLQNSGTPLVRQYNFMRGITSNVTSILFNGGAKDDIFQNDSSLASNATGGLGNDRLLGGFGGDSLNGGDGNDYLDGRSGDDLLYGWQGNDFLYGDAGADSIWGMSGNDTMAGGDGEDRLYPDQGADWLDGGPGSDHLFHTFQGTPSQMLLDIDRYYDDATGNAEIHMGPGDIRVYGHFEWFDVNLQDATLRPQARLAYRDGSLQRTDMLDLYAQAGKNSYVSTSEFNDLRDLTSNSLTMPDDVRALAKKVAFHERANQWYQTNTLGDLVAGANGTHLGNLVNKWFLGLDRPEISDDALAGTTYKYIPGSIVRSGISHQDVSQGGTGDCYFLAALADVAQENSTAIQNMMIDNLDGTFTVRLYHANGGAADYVTVDRYLPAWPNGLAQYARFGNVNTPTSNELWVALVEKAYAQINESDWIGQNGTNSYAGISGGSSTKALEHITGRNASSNNVFIPFGAQTSQQYKQALINADQAGKSIVMCTFDSGTHNGVVANHCYSLVGYNAASGRFTVRNPWGANSSTAHPETLNLTWSQIIGNFNDWSAVTA